MKIARFLMFVFACVLIPATAIDAEAVYESKGFEYTVSNEGTATITRYSGTESVLVVPSDLDGYTVTVIDDDAFSSCEGLEEITLPDSIVEIEDDAFCWCSDLETITFGAGLEKIGDRAFYYCESLKEVVLPERLLELGEEAFYNCDSLVSVIFPAPLENIDEGTFSWCVDLETVSFGEGLKSIGDNAFYYCESLEELIFPEGFEELGKEAFYNCESLKNVVFPDSLDSIEKDCFSWCVDLETVSFGRGLKKIDDNAFYYCESLEEIVLPEGFEELGKDAFYNCESAKKIVIPNTLDEIVDNTFGWCSDLEELYLGSGLKKIGEDAFSGAEDCELIVYPSTYAEKWAKENNLSYILQEDGNENPEKSIVNDIKIDEAEEEKSVAEDLSAVAPSEAPLPLCEANGHQNGEWVIVQEASLVTAGVEEMYCPVCAELLDSRETVIKEPEVYADSFNFTAIEFIEWLEKITSVRYEYDAESEDVEEPNELAYTVSFSDLEKGRLYLKLREEAVISVRFQFESWETAAALALLVGENIDSDFSSTAALVPIATNQSYSAAGMTVVRSALENGKEATVLAPDGFFVFATK